MTRSSPGPSLNPETLTFRHLTVDIPVWIAFGLLGLYALGYAAWRWPQEILSPKGVFAVVILVAGAAVIGGVVWKSCRTNWRFTLTPSHLVAVHVFTRKRAEIPWEAIVRVRKLPRLERGGLTFNQIETADGKHIPFGVHLLGYERFVAELKARARNCVSFEAYTNEWDR